MEAIFLADPQTRESFLPVALDAQAGQQLDSDLLQRPHVRIDVQPKLLKVQNGIEHQLPGVVGGGSAAATDLDEVDAPPGQFLWPASSLLELLWAPSVITGGCSTTSTVSPNLPSPALLLQLLLQGQHLPILGHPAIADGQSIGCPSLLIL